MSNAITAQLQLERSGFRLEAELDLPGAGITAIFGPSGAGKTTLLRALAGLEHCAGELHVDGQVWQDANTFLPPHQRPVGYVFQEASLFEHLTVQGNLNYALQRASGSTTVSFDTVIGLLSLDKLLHKLPAKLSGGEQKQVAIGRALLRNPRLMLLDEPLASLDLQHRQELLPFLESLRTETNIPMLYVSHSPEEVARLADHLVLMDHGKVTATGSLNELLTDTRLAVAHDANAAAVVEAEAIDWDPDYELSTLKFAGGQLHVVGHKPDNNAVRVRIFARDVSITLQHQSDTSILNILPATVLKVEQDSPGQVLLQLDVGGTRLLARLTRKSVDALDLAPGSQVYAQIKTAALI